MRIVALACLTAGSLVLALRGARAADDIPEPRLDRIDYSRPDKYLAVPETLAKKATLDRIVGEIKGTTPFDKLAGIGAWMDAHLKLDESTFSQWRDVDHLLDDGTFGGCADHATFYGAVARGCGIP